MLQELPKQPLSPQSLPELQHLRLQAPKESLLDVHPAIDWEQKKVDLSLLPQDHPGTQFLLWAQRESLPLALVGSCSLSLLLGEGEFRDIDSRIVLPDIETLQKDDRFCKETVCSNLELAQAANYYLGDLSEKFHCDDTHCVADESLFNEALDEDSRRIDLPHTRHEYHIIDGEDGLAYAWKPSLLGIGDIGITADGRLVGDEKALNALRDRKVEAFIEDLDSLSMDDVLTLIRHKHLFEVLEFGEELADWAASKEWSVDELLDPKDARSTAIRLEKIREMLASDEVYSQVKESFELFGLLHPEVQRYFDAVNKEHEAKIRSGEYYQSL